VVLAVKKNKALNPVCVGFLGVNAVVPGAQLVAQLIPLFWRFYFGAFIRKIRV
jgi:hypothetical protein